MTRAAQQALVSQCAMRLPLVAVVVVASLTGCGGSPSASPSPAKAKAKPILLHTNKRCADDREVKPATITLACATGGLRIENLGWTGWGSNTAKASGVFNVQGCDPSCAQDNRTYAYSVDVTAHQPVDCPDGSRQYAFVKYTVTDNRFDSNRPHDGTMGFECPK